MRLGPAPGPPGNAGLVHRPSRWHTGSVTFIDYPNMISGDPTGLLFQRLKAAADPSRIVVGATITYGEPDDCYTAIVVSLYEHAEGTTVYCREIEEEPPAEVPFVQDGPTLFD